MYLMEIMVKSIILCFILKFLIALITRNHPTVISDRIIQYFLLSGFFVSQI